MNTMRRARGLALSAVLALAVAFAIAASVSAQDTALPPSPAVTVRPEAPKARGGPCVRDPAFMRRNHMELLKHQRDATMYKGERGKPEGLSNCVSCHAVQNDHVKFGPFARFEDSKHFCRSCHDYAAVRIDCFQCHASTPDTKTEAHK